MFTSTPKTGRDYEDRMLWTRCRGKTYSAGSELDAYDAHPLRAVRSSLVTCICCRDTGWLCEQHRTEEHPHACGAPGIPCPLCNAGNPPRMLKGFVSLAKVEE